MTGLECMYISGRWMHERVCAVRAGIPAASQLFYVAVIVKPWTEHLHTHTHDCLFCKQSQQILSDDVALENGLMCVGELYVAIYHMYEYDFCIERFRKQCRKGRKPFLILIENENWINWRKIIWHRHIPLGIISFAKKDRQFSFQHLNYIFVDSSHLFIQWSRMDACIPIHLCLLSWKNCRKKCAVRVVIRWNGGQFRNVFKRVFFARLYASNAPDIPSFIWIHFHIHKSVLHLFRYMISCCCMSFFCVGWICWKNISWWHGALFIHMQIKGSNENKGWCGHSILRTTAV